MLCLFPPRCWNCQNGISVAQSQTSTSIDAAMNATQPFGFLLGAVLLATLLLFLTSSVRTANCPVMEEQCTTATCSVPNCNCATESPPGGLYPNNVPQLVVFAFMGPLNNDSWYQLQGIFDKKRVNPNGERITMTLFFTDNGTDDYCRAGEFYRDGHEIGVTGSDVMASLKPSKWEEAIMYQKKNLTKKAKVDKADIRGMRAPELKSGADRQFEAMESMSDKTRHSDNAWNPYDSSIVLGEKEQWKNTLPLWPYTMNYRVFDIIRPHNDHPASCYPGVWEIPVQRFYDNYSTAHVFIDEWVGAENYEMLYYTIAQNFWRHYSNNRAPFIINARTDWFKKDLMAEKAVERFIDVLLAHAEKDVYVVSMDQMLDWMKHPVPLDKVKESDLFKRQKKRSGEKCNIAKLNAQLSKNGTIMLLIEGGILLMLLVVLIAKDRAED